MDVKEDPRGRSGHPNLVWHVIVLPNKIQRIRRAG